MKPEERKNLVQYRLERAEETFKEIPTLCRHAYWNTAANRLYYAAFYAVSALLLQNGHTIQTHKRRKNTVCPTFRQNRAN